jgi:hypothetical protein
MENYLLLSKLSGFAFADFRGPYADQLIAWVTAAVNVETMISRAKNGI